MSAERSCPICQGTRSRVFWREIQTPHRVLRCSSCGAIFSDLSLQGYADEQHNAWNEEEVSEEVDLFYRVQREHVHNQFLDEAATLVQGRRVLDIGCGLGAFIERAAGRGWDAYGVEPSEFWAKEAGRRVGADHVRQGNFEDSDFASEQFDLITLWDVIEHVWDPVPLLQAAAKSLAPGGALFVRTPNIRYVAPVYALRRKLGETIDLGATNHVIHFSSSSLGDALTQAGLARQDWRTFSPPQVPIERGGRTVPGSVTAKVAFARLSDTLSRTSGSAAIGSDLDVFARRA